MRKTWACGAALAAMVAASAASGADAFMGDWQGSMELYGRGNAPSKKSPLAAQVIPLGDGKYRANILSELDKRIPPIVVLDGLAEGGKATFKNPKAAPAEPPLARAVWTATLAEGKAQGTIEQVTFPLRPQVAEGKRLRQVGRFALERVVRLSPTLGAKPPEGAIVLFDGTSLDAFADKRGRPIRWKLLKDATAMEVRGGGIISKHKFADHKLHVEFRTPYMPTRRGQGRGNSGVYAQGRYECQILDSYGLEGRANECGGIYGVGRPRVNMCAPPLQWQTYDITFLAPRFGPDGKKTQHARMTVLHNGIAIHDNADVPRPTTACWDRNIAQPGGLHLQDHGCPVQFRNIWAVELRRGDK